MKQDNPFAKLAALDQKLYQETAPPTKEGQVDHSGNPESQNTREQAFQNSRNPENKKAGKPETTTQVQIPEIQKAGNPELEAPLKREFFTKATYRLCDEALDAIGDAKRILKRQYKLKVNLEEIVETAILEAYKDLLQKKEKSYLVSRYSGKPENKNS